MQDQELILVDYNFWAYLTGVVLRSSKVSTYIGWHFIFQCYCFV